MKKKIIIMMGPPGSGKGTQSKKILMHLKNMFHLSTGDILRENIKNNTKLGEKAKDFVHEGKLVPDDLINDMILTKLKEDTNFILDGYPRNASQATLLKKEASSLNKKIITLNFDIPSFQIIKRNTNRLICSKCHISYNKISKKPKKDNICDNCHSPLYQRNDDKKETIEKRLEIYETQTIPSLPILLSFTSFYDIDASLSSDKIFKTILDLLNE